ncbi:MAG: DeoR/GlpR transcriptional regulator [Spirochaetes bacterium]|nr:DeoR/GlpR transcriptional regulator [Spirochaetota bacterium]
MMIAEKRRQQILSLIEEHGAIRISNLGKRFNVTDMTIRRDIDFLSQQGLVNRVHGGAISEKEGNLQLATTFLKRNREFRPEKERIASRACSFVSAGDTIIIDGGSTNECFARALSPALHLKIVTHGLNIAYSIAAHENHELYVPGGMLNRLTMTFTGREVEAMYEEVNADTLFLCASGLSLKKGLTDPVWLDTSIKKTMIRSSRKVILLLDSHKFELVSSRTFASPDEVDIVITDNKLDPAIRSKYQSAGVKLIIA